MDENHLSRSTWDCKYHVVFGSKYRTNRSGLRWFRLVPLRTENGLSFERPSCNPDMLEAPVQSQP